MKVTYNEILSANQALRKMVRTATDANVTPLAALRLARAARVITQEAEAFESVRVAMIRKCAGEPDEKGNLAVPPDQAEEFSAELAELGKQEIEIDAQPIKLADFGESQIGLTMLIGMEWLIEA